MLYIHNNIGLNILWSIYSLVLLFCRLKKCIYLCTAKFIINLLKTGSMNHYETVFILTPVLSEAQMKEAVEKFTNLLKAEGAEIVNEENWGLRKLAYPIDKKTTGFYQLVEFDAEPTVIAKLEIQFRRDERVLRFLTFRQDKYAAEYAVKRRGLKSSTKETVKEN